MKSLIGKNDFEYVVSSHQDILEKLVLLSRGLYPKKDKYSGYFNQWFDFPIKKNPVEEEDARQEILLSFSRLIPRWFSKDYPRYKKEFRKFRWFLFKLTTPALVAFVKQHYRQLEGDKVGCLRRISKKSEPLFGDILLSLQGKNCLFSTERLSPETRYFIYLFFKNEGEINLRRFKRNLQELRQVLAEKEPHLPFG